MGRVMPGFIMRDSKVVGLRPKVFAEAVAPRIFQPVNSATAAQSF